MEDAKRTPGEFYLWRARGSLKAGHNFSLQFAACAAQNFAFAQAILRKAAR